jgi:HSP20 family protein
MDSLVQHFFGEEGSGNGGREYLPSINVAETDQGYEVTVDLPGMNPENISGKREVEQEESGKRFHRVERRYGEFRRVITVPTAVDEKKITADYQQGVLKVLLPKSEKVKPTRIPIKS